MGILPTKSKKIVDPLFVHGFVLLGDVRPIVLCAVDWCEIRNGAYDRWRDALATAAGTTRERVLLCALHQHDAPVVDSDAAKLLSSVGLANELYDEAFFADAVARTAQSVADCLKHTTRITHIGTGRARVDRIASNRKVVMPNGDVSFQRGSRSAVDEFHRTAPKGKIDPYLKTISFWNEDKAVLALHAYATHPMSYYGLGEVSSDFVGLARERRQRDDFSIKQIYVSGCSGNITAGKFNDGSAESRLALTQRLYQAIVRAWENTQRFPLNHVAFRNAKLSLDFHPHPSLEQEAISAELGNSQATIESRIYAAMSLASRYRVAQHHAIDMPTVDFGTANIILFPGESFVEYQLMAQRMRPNSFVFSIGYGECWPGYIPTERAFEEGFHDKWLWAAPGSESRVRDALDLLLTER